MNLLDILFKKKPASVEFYLKNDDCKKALHELLNSTDADKMVSLMIAWEIETGKPHRPIEGYQRIIGHEPSHAIFMLDQWHHRIQHEGVQGYD